MSGGGFLHGLDRIIGPLVWVVAAALVLMLFIGPQVVAEDKPSSNPSADVDGKELFAENCGSCHTLSAAGTSGTVGPSLDGVGLSADTVADTVRSGSGAMPAFEGQLDDAQIEAIAKFVEQASAP